MTAGHRGHHLETYQYRMVGFIRYLIPQMVDFHDFVFMNGLLQNSREPKLTKQHRDMPLI